ncbi:MAG TPA: T9SS type A sorting domain-containing protein, partial [Saprospiraceae bacterium]|nr:T9SS type A sorting domain-containing protein [Saprospiraceae bacterium]
GRTYSVRNASAAPFHSIRFKTQGAGIAAGQSDIFEYTLPAQADPDFVLAAVRLESGAWYEAHLNVFGCPVQTLVDRPGERAALGSQAQWPKFYPNPASERLNIDLRPWAGQAIRVQVFDALGRQLIDRQENASADPLRLDISALETGGVFVLVVRDDKGAQLLGRFLRL